MPGLARAGAVVALVGAGLGTVGSFLPWWTLSFDLGGLFGIAPLSLTVTGINEWPGIFVLLASVALIPIAIVSLATRAAGTTRGLAIAVVVLAGLATASTLYGIFAPALVVGGGGVASLDTSPAMGSFVALAAMAGALVGGNLSLVGLGTSVLDPTSGIASPLAIPPPPPSWEPPRPP